MNTSDIRNLGMFGVFLTIPASLFICLILIYASDVKEVLSVAGNPHLSPPLPPPSPAESGGPTHECSARPHTPSGHSVPCYSVPADSSLFLPREAKALKDGPFHNYVSRSEHRAGHTPAACSCRTRLECLQCVGTVLSSKDTAADTDKSPLTKLML